MKLFSLILLFFTSVTQALTFSGGKDNMVHLISAEVLQRAYTKVGLNPKFDYMALQESLIQANSGRTDGEISRIRKITTKYPNLVEVPVVINYVEAISFSKDPLVKIEKWSDLESYKIAIVKGAKFIEKGTLGMDRVMAPGFIDAFELLQNNEVDLVVTAKATGLFMIYKYKYHNIKPVGSVLQRLDLFHFVNKKNVNLLPLITPVLKEMSLSGEIRYIRGAYLNKILGF